jgi:hypothetical protein
MWLEDLKIRRLLSSFNHKKKRGQKTRKWGKEIDPYEAK